MDINPSGALVVDLVSLRPLIVRSVSLSRVCEKSGSDEHYSFAGLPGFPALTDCPLSNSISRLNLSLPRARPLSVVVRIASTKHSGSTSLNNAR